MLLLHRTFPLPEFPLSIRHTRGFLMYHLICPLCGGHRIREVQQLARCHAVSKCLRPQVVRRIQETLTEEEMLLAALRAPRKSLVLD